MNVMSWNKVYALFPDLTFIKRANCRLKNKDDLEVREHNNCAKYARRGWPTLERITGLAGTRSKSVTTKKARHVGDKRTWTMSLNVAGVQASETPDYVLENCFFGMRIHHLTQRYVVRALLCDPFIFEHAYTTCEDAEDMWQLAHGKIVALTHEVLNGLLDVDPSAVPEWTLEAGESHFQVHLRDDVRFPPGFRPVYFDDVVPRWHENWIRHEGDENCCNFNVGEWVEIGIGWLTRRYERMRALEGYYALKT